MRRLALIASTLLLTALAARGEDRSPPTGKVPGGRALKTLVRTYLDAPFQARAAMRKTWDETLAPLDPATLGALRRTLLKIALKHGPKLAKGTHYFLDEKTKRGKYILSGKAGKAMFLGLHGGGQGVGDAGSAAGAMGGGGWLWIYPEVLQKTARGWTSPGTEAFVIDLIQAAKRTWKNIDPNRIFITGHSMGGFGSWTIGAHHADMFAGIAPYAGAPTPVTTPSGSIVVPGIIPNLYGVPIHFYQSGDDRNVPPEANDLAYETLKRWKKAHPEGFEFQYDRVEGRGHAAPKQGYLPSQRWLASHDRKPRPRKFLWQPVLSWKRQFYWVYWAHAEMESILQVEAKPGNRVEITTLEGGGDYAGLSILIGAPCLDPTKAVTIEVDGERRFQGRVTPSFSTLMLTLPRLDKHLLFDTRVDL